MGQQAELDGMPEPGVLCRMVGDGVCVVTCGRSVLYRYDAADTGMRNLAIVALTDAGRRVDEVAEVFGLTATYVSMLRGRARRRGSAGLVRRRGRPTKLGERQVVQARRWAAAGRSQEWIGERLGVARSVISRLLAQLGPLPTQPELPGTDLGVVAATADDEPAEPEPAEPEPAEPAGAGTDEPVAPAVATGRSARIGEGVERSRYAGATLLHAYLDRVGAADIFATVTGAAARRYDNLAVLTSATVGFALGIDTVEGAKHLRRADAGVAVGLARVPELRTLRARLAALADGSDPLALQRSFARGALAADPPSSGVYFVDDHFVPYSGARPVAKGYNTKRRHAQPGRADTLVTDSRGRAVCFASGEPSGLTRTLPAVLDQLQEVTGPGVSLLLGFDRGGSYPAAFTACRTAGVDWITYRRGGLAPVTAEPRRSWARRDGRRVYVSLADETVELSGYGPARQLTLIESGAPVLQVLTSDTTAPGAALLFWLRARWRIENAFKYATAHHGIDALADYVMDIGPDQARVANPARLAARQQVAAAEAAVATAERGLAQALTDTTTSPRQKNTALPTLHDTVEGARAALATAREALAPIPAQLPATELDPDAKRARPRLERRGLQMVLRLLAYNAEAWLAEHLNTYLADPNEFRAITRHLLHLSGQLAYTRDHITVTLDRPDTPRVAHALELLTEELNATPVHLPGDRRRLSYRVSKP